IKRQVDPEGGRPCQERRTVAFAEGVYHAFCLSVRLLYCGFFERRPSAARASGAQSGGAGRTREDHCRGARRTPVPLYRLHQISRGRARRDSGRSRTLSLAELSEARVATIVKIGRLPAMLAML